MDSLEHFTFQSSLVKDGDVDPRREGNFGNRLRPERGRISHERALNMLERGRYLRQSGCSN